METSKLYLSSAHADEVVDGEYKFYLANHVSLPALAHRFSVALYDASIPLSYYNVFDGNDRLELSINAAPVTIVLEHGIYDIEELVESLNDAAAAGSFEVGFAYDPVKLKVHITAAMHDVVVGSGTANKLLGLTSGSTVLAGTSSLGAHAVNMMRTQSIFVRSSLQTRNFTTQSRHDTLAKIPVDCCMGGVVVYRGDHENESGVPHVTVLTIRLVDDEGRWLDLNGLPFSMTIGLTARRHDALEVMPHGDGANL